jgi:hypothetical protein
MTWTTPAFEQVKMDAEIGSYNEDPDPAREPLVDRSATRFHREAKPLRAVVGLMSRVTG